MTLKEFQLALRNELTRRGIPEKVADAKTKMLVKTFTEEDLKEVDGYRSPDDFADISESLIEIIMVSDETPDDPVMNAGTIEFTMPDTDKTEDPSVENSKTSEMDVVTADDDSEIYLEDDEESDALTAKGRGIFLTLTILTAPIWLIASGLITLMFAMVYLAVFGIIAFLILFSIGIVCLGVVLLFVDIIYGGSLIAGSSLGIGLFEIGIGFIAIGAGCALAVLSYNLAIRVMPYVVKHVASFWKFMWERIMNFVSRMKVRCNNL